MLIAWESKIKESKGTKEVPFRKTGGCQIQMGKVQSCGKLRTTFLKSVG